MSASSIDLLVRKAQTLTSIPLDDMKVVLTSKSFATMEKTLQRCHIHVNADGFASGLISPAIDSSTDTIKACFSSLPGSQMHWTVILREVPTKADKRKRLVELWKEERCYKWADVTEHHGEFIIHGEQAV